MKEGTRGSFSFIEPMKALPVEELPEVDWLYEIKHDGYRALGFKDGREARLVSRNKKTVDYPQEVMRTERRNTATRNVGFKGSPVAEDVRSPTRPGHNDLLEEYDQIPCGSR